MKNRKGEIGRDKEGKDKRKGLKLGDLGGIKHTVNNPPWMGGGNGDNENGDEKIKKIKNNRKVKV